jgi:hypothetical protein
MLFTTGAFAQDLPRIAVYVTGEFPENEKNALGTRMLSALVKSGRYNAIERSNAFLAKIEEEHVTQRSGAIDDDQISELGRQFGVQFVCIANITPAFGAFQVSARIINVETAEVAFIGEASSRLKTMNDFARVSDNVVRNMFSRQDDDAPRLVRLSAGAGGFFTSDFGGGLSWSVSGERVTMPFYGGGAYLFFDATYAEFFAGYSQGGGRWAKPDAADNADLPEMPRTYVNFGLFAKYPLNIESLHNISLFPIVGIDYEISLSGKLIYDNGNEYPFDGEVGRGGRRPNAGDLSALWVKLGAGADFNLGKNAYLRTQLLYGVRMPNAFEKDYAEADNHNAKTNIGHGLTFRVGAGLKF